MDLDIWNWSYDEGESSYFMESGWQADFYFGSGRDPVEENVMNVKSCIQVLKILIGKADDDIDELERDLLLLQCDLAWREDNNQFELYCNALREKINAIDCSIKSLRQSDAMNTDDRLPLPRQPAEKLCEVLKPLPGEGCQQDDEKVISTSPCQQDNDKVMSPTSCQQDNETVISPILCQQDDEQTPTSMNYQSTDTWTQSVGDFYDTSSISSIIVKSEEMEDNGSLPEADTLINGSFLKHEKNGNIPGAKDKPDISISEVCSHALITANASLKLANLGNSASKLKIEEAKEHCIDAMGSGRKLKSSSVLDGECSPPETQKLGKSVFEAVDPDVSRRSDGFSGNKRSFDSNSSILVQSKSGNSNVEEKLIDFLRYKKSKCNEEPIGSESNRSASSCLSSNTKGKVLKTEEPGPFDTWNIPIIFLSKLQDQQGEDTSATSSQTTELDSLSLEPEDSQNVENISHDCKPKSFVEKVQRQSKSSTSFSKAKKHRKPQTNGDNALLAQLFERKPQLKSVERHQFKAEVQGDALDADKNLGLLLQNKGTPETSVGQEPVVADVSISYRIKPESKTNKDIRMVKSCSKSDDCSTETMTHLPFTSLKFQDLTQEDLRSVAKQYKLSKYDKLQQMTLVDLRILAKHFKVTKFHKVRKQAMIEMIVNKMEKLLE